MNFKKKLIIGLLSGAMILSGNSVNAEPETADPDNFWQEDFSTRHDNWMKYFSAEYGIDAARKCNRNLFKSAQIFF